LGYLIPEKDYLVVTDFYTSEEYDLVWNELQFAASKLYPSTIRPYINHGAYFLEDAYSDPLISDILCFNKKLYEDPISNTFQSINPLYKNYRKVNHTATIINKVLDGEGLPRPHIDVAVYAAVIWIHKDEFTGGELVIEDLNLHIEPQNNTCIILPAGLTHYVKPIQGGDRYSIVTFMGISPYDWAKDMKQGIRPDDIYDV
jgi:hypothetical protein